MVFLRDLVVLSATGAPLTSLCSRVPLALEPLIIFLSSAAVLAFPALFAMPEDGRGMFMPRLPPA